MTDEEFSALAERVDTLTTWAAQHGWTLFTDRALVEIDKHNRRILRGDLTPDEYQRACGVIQGMQTLLTLPEQVTRDFQHVLQERAEAAEQMDALEEAVA